MNLIEYDNMPVKDLIHIPDWSRYNHNWYRLFNGESIYAISDDDNYTEYFLNGVPVAESFTSEGDIIHVYKEYMGD